MKKQKKDSIGDIEQLPTKRFMEDNRLQLISEMLIFWDTRRFQTLNVQKFWQKELEYLLTIGFQKESSCITLRWECMHSETFLLQFEQEALNLQLLMRNTKNTFQMIISLMTDLIRSLTQQIWTMCEKCEPLTSKKILDFRKRLMTFLNLWRNGSKNKRKTNTGKNQPLKERWISLGDKETYWQRCS